MKNNYRVLALTLLLGSTLLTACKKEDEIAPIEKQNFASAQATIDIITEIQSLNGMLASALPTTSGNPGGRIVGGIEEPSGGCGITTNYPLTGHTISTTLDFGTGTTCNGKVFKGKIIFTFLPPSPSGELGHTAQFDGYEFDGKKVEGSYVITALINRTEKTFLLTTKFIDVVLTYPDGTQAKWNSNYKESVKYTEGPSVPSGNTNVSTMSGITSVEGGITGTNRSGKQFSANITSPLLIDSACQKGYTKGTYLIKAADHPDALLDFGNGECDNVATLTINGKSQEITIQP